MGRLHARSRSRSRRARAAATGIVEQAAVPVVAGAGGVGPLSKAGPALSLTPAPIAVQRAPDEEADLKRSAAEAAEKVERNPDFFVKEVIDPWAAEGADRWDKDHLAEAYTGKGTRDPRTARAGIVGPTVEEFRGQIGADPTTAVPKPPPAIMSANEWAKKKGRKATRIENVTLTRAELYEIVGQNAAAAAKGHEAELDTYLDHVATAFRITKIDTVEAQAAYLAHAAGEAIFAYLTEGQKKPFVDDPAQVEIKPDKEGPVRYRGKADIDPLGKIDPRTNPSYEETFIGRGPVQVTNEYNYVRTLIYLEEMAKKASAADAQLLWEAVAAIKKDPREAARPKYSFLFSAAYMHQSGGVRQSADLAGSAPTFSGQDPASSWVAGGGFNIYTRYSNALQALNRAREGGNAEEIGRAQRVYNEWKGHKSRAEIKAAAYGRALSILKKKAEQQQPTESP